MWRESSRKLAFHGRGIRMFRLFSPVRFLFFFRLSDRKLRYASIFFQINIWVNIRGDSRFWGRIICYRLWSNEERERGGASIYSAIIYDSNLFDKFSSLSREIYIYIYTNTWKLVFQALSNEYATPILRWMYESLRTYVGIHENTVD